MDARNLNRLVERGVAAARVANLNTVVGDFDENPGLFQKELVRVGQRQRLLLEYGDRPR